ncbi:MAG: MoaD/ThiS family protein [Rhodospirillales bacterium]
MDHDRIGHNVGDLAIEVEVRLFNSLSRFASGDGCRRVLALPAGSTVGDILDRLRIPAREVYLALQNGRDITASLYADLNIGRAVDHGDVVAFSGPVPYSWGYGSPVV